MQGVNYILSSYFHNITETMTLFIAIAGQAEVQSTGSN